MLAPYTVFYFSCRSLISQPEDKLEDYDFVWYAQYTYSTEVQETNIQFRANRS